MQKISVFEANIYSKLIILCNCYLFILYLYFSSIEALLARQPPRTNGSRDLCSLIFTVPDNVQKHWREGGGGGGGRGDDKGI